jgi:polysaccharide pyruvyl transferase WcaK-like protein
MIKNLKSRVRRKLGEISRKVGPSCNGELLTEVAAITTSSVNWGGGLINHVAVYSDKNGGDTLLPRCLRDVFEEEGGVAVRWSGANAHQLVTKELVSRFNEGDGVLVGGGGLFLCDTNRNSLSGWQWSCSVDALSQIRVPLALFAVGYNRFRGQTDFSPLFKKHLGLLAEKSVYIGLRNHGSIESVKQYLPSELHTKLRFQPCMTIFCKKLYPEICDVVCPKKRPIISLNCAFDRAGQRFGEKQGKILENIALVMRELSQGVDIKYYAHCQADESVLPTLDRMGVPYTLVRLYGVDPRSVVEAYSSIDLSIGMRGHAQMIPFGCGVPIVSLVSHDKMRWFLDDISHPEWGVEVTDDGFFEELRRKALFALANKDHLQQEIDAIQVRLLDITRVNVAEFMNAIV